MKKFLCRSIVFWSLFMLSTTIVGSLFILFILHFTRPFSDYSYDGGLRIKKERLLKYAHQKKIIFIGGSNVNMGLNSALIQKAFPAYVVINYGHRFQTGLDFYLREIYDYIYTGDVVVLMPEYQLLSNESDMITPIFFEHLHLAPFPYEDFKKIILRTPKYLSERLKTGLYYANKPEADSIIGYDKYGDYVAHWKLRRVDKIGVFADLWGLPFQLHSIKNLAKFIQQCAEDHITFLIVPPVYAERSFMCSSTVIRANTRLFDSLGMPYLSSPKSFIMDDTFFFNTPYHPTSIGVQIRTQRLIEVLAKVIPKNTPPPDEIMNYYLV